MVSLSGADGYNNAVYLINEMCTTLYSGSQGTTRSLNIEDLEDNYFSEEAIRTRDNSNYGTTKRQVNYSQYPNILTQEKGMGVGTTLIDGKNQIRTDGLGQSEQDKLYIGIGDASTLEATNQGITVTQNNYDISSDDSNFKSTVLKNIFHNRVYWLASRAITNNASSFSYNLKYYNVTNNRGVGSRQMFNSMGNIGSFAYGIRPIIDLNSGTEAKYDRAYNSTYDKWELK